MACASIAWDAWERMLFFVNSIISFAISTSRIRDSAEDKFSEAVVKLLIVCSKRFCTAPKLLLCADTFVNAALTLSIAALADHLSVTSIWSISSALERISFIDKNDVWPPFAPICVKIAEFTSASASCFAPNTKVMDSPTFNPPDAAALARPEISIETALFPVPDANTAEPDKKVKLPPLTLKSVVPLPPPACNLIVLSTPSLS